MENSIAPFYAELNISDCADMSIRSSGMMSSISSFLDAYSDFVIINCDVNYLISDSERKMIDEGGVCVVII